MTKLSDKWLFIGGPVEFHSYFDCEIILRFYIEYYISQVTQDAIVVMLSETIKLGTN